MENKAMRVQNQTVKFRTIGKRLAAQFGYEAIETVKIDTGNGKMYRVTAKDGDTLHEIDFDTFKGRVIVVRDRHFMQIITEEEINLDESARLVDVNLYADEQ